MASGTFLMKPAARCCDWNMKRVFLNISRAHSFHFMPRESLNWKKKHKNTILGTESSNLSKSYCFLKHTQVYRVSPNKWVFKILLLREEGSSYFRVFKTEMKMFIKSSNWPFWCYSWKYPELHLTYYILNLIFLNSRVFNYFCPQISKLNYIFNCVKGVSFSSVSNWKK